MTVLQKSFTSQTIDDLLAEWNDPYGSRTVGDAEDLISALQIELAGKEEVIKMLHKDVAFYKRYQTEKYKKEDCEMKPNPIDA